MRLGEVHLASLRGHCACRQGVHSGRATCAVSSVRLGSAPATQQPQYTPACARPAPPCPRAARPAAAVRGCAGGSAHQLCGLPHQDALRGVCGPLLVGAPTFFFFCFRFCPQSFIFWQCAAILERLLARGGGWLAGCRQRQGAAGLGAAILVSLSAKNSERAAERAALLLFRSSSLSPPLSPLLPPWNLKI